MGGYLSGRTSLTTVQTADVADDAITSAKIADNAVINAKTNFTSTSSAAGLQIKGDGTTDGMLQLNCSQNTHGIKIKSPPHSATASYTLTMPNDDGDANEFLQTNGSGVLDWASAGGGYSLVSTTNASSSTTVDISGMESGYDYMINITQWKGSGNIVFYGYVGVAGPTFRTANYRSHWAEINYSGASGGAQETNRVPISYTNASGDANEESHFRVELLDPANASVKTQFFTRGATCNSSNNQYWVNAQGKYLTAEANTDFRFYVSSGNIASGIFKVYRRANV